MRRLIERALNFTEGMHNLEDSNNPAENKVTLADVILMSANEQE